MLAMRGDSRRMLLLLLTLLLPNLGDPLDLNDEPEPLVAFLSRCLRPLLFMMVGAFKLNRDSVLFSVFRVTVPNSEPVSSSSS